MDDIHSIINESIEVHQRLGGIIGAISRVSDVMLECINTGGKVMFAGNGGSAGDAQHFAAELVNRFLRERRPIAGMALTTDTSIITAVANDYSFDEIFSKQVSAFGKKGDCFFGISTSGNSKNIVRAISEASSMGITTIGLTGEHGRMETMVDHLIAVPSGSTPRIQEAHILIIHILCGIIEEGL
ncbi:MAG: SIS domain-containing protein [Thermodesulfobacteriota bacterium]|nr:SIS domain-containing protein [Thermodesulfobacteriota bacterium]